MSTFFVFSPITKQVMDQHLTNEIAVCFCRSIVLLTINKPFQIALNRAPFILIKENSELVITDLNSQHRKKGKSTFDEFEPILLFQFKKFCKYLLACQMCLEDLSKKYDCNIVDAKGQISFHLDCNIAS